MTTYVYVDGFNLYYGALRRTRFKWLDVRKLCSLILPRHTVKSVKYFTARIAGFGGDPRQRSRQNTYLRALGTLDDIEIIYGHFTTNDVWMPGAGAESGKREFVKVTKTEEKGSDVNLATHMLKDGFQGRYEAAVVITNDSDLALPVRVVRQDLKLPVGIINPHRVQSMVLAREASFVRRVRRGALKESQLPRVIADQFGTIRKPTGW